MIDDEDAYGARLSRVAPEMRGMESKIRITGGQVEMVAAPKPDGFAKWKGARRIMAIPDANISVIAIRASDGQMTFTIDGVTVTWPHGKDLLYVCGKRGHGNHCGHTKRIDKYRKDNYE